MFYVAHLIITTVLTQDFIIEPEFKSVTCGSTIKLAHSSGCRLHSHDVKYGTGSGQQSITCYPNGNDPNSYFVVEGCESRGTPIKCKDTILLRHAKTQKLLHSHDIKSPLSENQEVSCYEHHDNGDFWIVGCSKGVWKREEAVTLQHKETGMFLSSNEKYKFGHPISGQFEVFGKARSDTWRAQEGIYISSE